MLSFIFTIRNILIQDGTTYKKKIIIFAFMKKFQTMKQKTKLKIPSYKHSR